MTQAAKDLGWHPYPGPAAITSQTYDNRPGCAYHGYCTGGGMALTASLEILKDMANGSGPKQAWLALGHSGWQPGQLDRELQDNAWLVVDGDAALVFDYDLEAKWQRVLDRLGGKSGAGTKFDPASYSHQVGRA